MSARLPDVETVLLKGQSILPPALSEMWDCQTCGLLELADVVPAFDDAKPGQSVMACVWCAGEVVASGIF